MAANRFEKPNYYLSTAWVGFQVNRNECQELLVVIGDLQSFGLSQENSTIAVDFNQVL
jgi:hypothetical protein